MDDKKPDPFQHLRESKEAASLPETTNNKNSSKKGLDRSRDTCSFLWPQESLGKLPEAALILYLSSERGLWAWKLVVGNKKDTKYPVMGIKGNKVNEQRSDRVSQSSAVPKNHHRPVATPHQQVYVAKTPPHLRGPHRRKGGGAELCPGWVYTKMTAKLLNCLKETKTKGFNQRWKGIIEKWGKVHLCSLE